jgi:hypothetical protein
MLGRTSMPIAPAPQTASSSPRPTKPILSPTCASSTPMLLEATGRLMPGWSCHSIPPQIFDPAQLVYDAPWREYAG